MKLSPRKKISISICIILISIFMNCNKGEEILSEFDGGQIKRKNLKEFYNTVNLPLNEQTTSLKYQTSAIESLAVESISEIEAEKKGKSKTETFKNILDLKEKQILVNLYRKTFLEKALDTKNLDLVFAQMLYIKKDQNGKPNTAKAESVWSTIQNLKSEKEINDFFAKETDEDGRKPASGLVEPQCMNCGKENILKEIFMEGFQSKEKNKFFKIELGNDIFVYRILETKEVKKDDLNSYIKKKYQEIISKAKDFNSKATSEQEKKLAEYYLRDDVQIEKEIDMIVQRYVNEFEGNLWNDEFKRIMTETTVQFSPLLKDIFDGKINALPVFQDSTLLYINNGINFTYKDLSLEYSKINLKKKIPTPNDIFGFFQSAHLPILLMSERKEVLSLKSSEKFTSNVAIWKKKISWSMLVEEIESQIPNPEENQIKDLYDVGKQTTYMKQDSANPTKRIPMSFSEARIQIIDEVRSSKLKAEIQRLVEKLKTDYKYKIYTDKLKPGTI